jgi:hypothetical protein
MRQTNGGDVPAGNTKDRLYAEVEKVTNEPMTQKKRSPWIWVSLGCIGIVAILGVIAIVATRNFLASEDGKNLMAGIQRSESLARSLPITAAGFEKYIGEKGDFPPNLDAMKGYIDDATLQKIKTEMAYTKPAKDAPAETTILTTGTKGFMQGSSMEIVMQKDLKFYQVTKQPLEAR